MYRPTGRRTSGARTEAHPMRVTTGWNGGRRPALPDAGPSAARYLVVLVGIGVALATAGLSAPSIGAAVRGRVCSQRPGSCATAVIPSVPVGSCRLLSHADPVTEDAVIFTDELGHSSRLSLSRTIDKFGIVHWFVRQDGGAGLGLEGRARKLLALGGGQVTEFDSEPTAREYLLATAHQPVKQDLAAMDASGVLARVGDSVDGHRLDGRPPSAYFAQGGNGLDLAAQTQAAVAGPAAGDGLAGLAEVKIDQGAGRGGTTVYHWLTAAAGAGFGLFPSGSALGPTAPGLTLLSIRYDQDGNPERLTIEAAGSLPARLGPAARAEPDVISGLLAPGPEVEPGRFTGRVVITVGLTDRVLLELAADALHELGVPVLPDAGSLPAPSTGGTRPAAASTAVRRLYQALDDGAEGASVTVNTYQLHRAAGQRSAVALGLQGGLTVTGALPAADFYYSPGQGFVKWRECSG